MSCVTLPCISTSISSSVSLCVIFLVSPQDLQQRVIPKSCVTLPCISTRSPAACHSQCPVSHFLVSPQDLLACHSQCPVSLFLYLHKISSRLSFPVPCHSSLYLHKISSSVSFPMSCVTLPCISTRSPAICPVSLFLVSPQDLRQRVIPNVLCHSSLYLHKISSSVSFPMSLLHFQQSSLTIVFKHQDTVSSDLFVYIVNLQIINALNVDRV